MEIKLRKLSACIKMKIFLFRRFHQTAAFFCLTKNINQRKEIKISCIKFLYENENTSEKYIIMLKS